MSGQIEERKCFARREELSRHPALWYKILPGLSYIVLLATAFYYTFCEPNEGDRSRHRFWQHQPTTLFAQSSLFTSIYWITVFVLQLIYVWSLWSSNAVYRAAAAEFGTHYVASNLLLFGFIHLWVRSYFWLAELLLVINFFNLSFAYFRHSNTPLIIHVGAVAGPLAWNFTALYWAGSVAVRSTHLASKIVAYLSLWGWLGYGVFYLAAYKDYAIGFALFLLSTSTGVGQFSSRLPDLQLQSIFAFTVAGILFALSLAVGFRGLLGHDLFPRGQIVSEDRERAPLLVDRWK